MTPLNSRLDAYNTWLRDRPFLSHIEYAEHDESEKPTRIWRIERELVAEL